MLDLQHRALAGLVRQALRFGHHAVEPGAFEPREPIGGDVAIARRGRDVNWRLDVGQRGDQPVAPFELAAQAQIIIAECEQIPRDVRARALGREHRDARRRGVNAREHRVEVEPAVVRDHDLAVEHAALGQARAQRDLELGEVAAERLEVAALDVDLIAGFPDQRAESVPLGLVQPRVALRNLRRELREHRLDGRLERQRERHARAAYAKVIACGSPPCSSR